MYEKINRETLLGIGYFIFKKEKEQEQLEKEKKEEIGGIGSRKIDSDEIDEFILKSWKIFYAFRMCFYLAKITIIILDISTFISV